MHCLQALGKGLSIGVGKIKLGSNTWAATQAWLKKSAGSFGEELKYIPGNEFHHWLIERNSQIGKMIPDFIKNQPWNLNSIPRSVHEAIHGNVSKVNLANGLGHNYNFIERWWYGTPNWFKGVETSLSTAVVAPNNSNCGCK